MTDRDSRLRALLYLLFAFSGFAGLIYESVWAQYLKLFLGHAAYAQSLVLMIFMGGMALGAWLIGRHSERLSQPLLAYAAVGLMLGVMALLFDRSFRGVQDWIYDAVIPVLDSGLLIDLVKWTAAGSLILPQSILLGATFPLMSAGIVRLSPSISGRTLSWLYFSNSLGAVFGVLTSGFVLIGLVGLPGTSLTAGLVNILLAAAVWMLVRARAQVVPTVVMAPDDPSRVTAPPRLLLWTALLTGTASFLYEIGWIRMLSLVLGSSTHAFELMLAAFILGLAIGSFMIRGRIQGLTDPLHALGIIQVVMGLLAVASAFAYMGMFDVMAWMIAALKRSPEGYILFNAGSWLICGLVMLPATICAGITLPLITHSLLRGGAGESAIGLVYAFNTIGAIVGVLAAVHLAMPWLGVKNTVLLGAAVDVGLGFWLLRGRSSSPPVLRQLATLGCLLVFLAGAQFRLDPQRLISGVFRTGSATSNGQVLYHRDGKTATVSVAREADGSVMIATNGKPDASLQESPATVDDCTMILLGVLPQMAVPDLRRAAVIGFGSGRSTHVLLQNPDIEQVDTVEIEPAMIEGARAMGQMARAAFEDPRSKLHLEDAKTFFARSKQRYDVIVSEPSNPWVSGVSGLFSVEYYQRLKYHINDGGVLVQWLHTYELDLPALATVLEALNQTFSDYRIYASQQGDLVVIASPDGAVPALDTRLLTQPGPIRDLLSTVDIHQPVDIQARWLGSKRTLGNWIRQIAPQPNSDYFPLLDSRSARARFMVLGSNELFELWPYAALLYLPPLDISRISPNRTATHLEGLYEAASVEELLGYGATWQVNRGQRSLPPDRLGLIQAIRGLLRRCDEGLSPIDRVALHAEFLRRYALLMRPEALQRLSEALLQSPCLTEASTVAVRQIEFARELAKRNWSGLVQLGLQLSTNADSGVDRDFFRQITALALIQSGQHADAAKLLQAGGTSAAMLSSWLLAKAESEQH